MAKRRRDSISGSAVVDKTTPPSKKAKLEEKKTLFVRALPPSATKDSLTDWFSQHYPVKHATVVLDAATKTSRGYGFVTFTEQEDAAEAKEKLAKVPFDGRRLKLDFAEPRHRDGHGGESGPAAAAREEKLKRKAEIEEARRPPKLIVRNLPWSIKHSDQLAALFRTYGKVKFADVPSNKGKLAGFGFVTLREKQNAQRAIDGVNGKVVDGRTLAVDWAVDKATWEQQKGTDEQNGTGSHNVAAGSDLDLPAKAGLEAPEVTGTVNHTEDDDEDDDVRNFLENRMENLEDEESDASGEEDDGNEVASDEGNEKAPAQKPPQSTDNSTTLFIRNLPFTTTEEELKAHFARFGPIRYARCVTDRATDRPAGTGFVCFFNLEDGTACLRSAPRQQPSAGSVKHTVLQNESVDHDGRYTLDGRVLQVSQAVSKEEATRLATEGPGAKRSHERDKRRLFLLAEGTIPTNSPLAGMMTPLELKMREASAKQRKKLVEGNPSLFISLTRIALRNIPRTMDSKALKALAREAVVEFAKDVDADRRKPLSREEVARGGLEDKEAERRRKAKGQGVVRQAKIIFESREGSKVAEQARDAAGSKSRGYGFIEYSSHRWALMGLRRLNGHALKNEAGKTQRLIAEFAIENAQVVLRRRNAQERARTKAQEPIGNPREKRVAAGDGTGHKRGRAVIDKEGKGSKKEKASETQHAAEKPSKGGDAKLALRQQIIGRKRMLRKRKGGMTGNRKK